VFKKITSEPNPAVMLKNINYYRFGYIGPMKKDFVLYPIQRSLLKKKNRQLQ
jgi:hypothetical protein